MYFYCKDCGFKYTGKFAGMPSEDGCLKCESMNIGKRDVTDSQWVRWFKTLVPRWRKSNGSR